LPGRDGKFARDAREFSVSPRQSGLAWTVCEERPLNVAIGERLRLRAVSYVESSDGEKRRLANGSTVVVRALDASGRLMLADGSRLLTRQVVHGYALTSHAAQGLTVDKVFLVGAMSREELYVSATRGREAIRVFVPDRAAFLDATRLKSEERMSALEFERRRATGMDLRSVLARGWRHLCHVQTCFAASLSRQSSIDAPGGDAAPKVTAVVRRKIALRSHVTDSVPLHMQHPPHRPQGMRMRL
jgi:hypothetical protein